MNRDAVNSTIIVDLKQLGRNVEEIKRRIAPAELMVTIKSNGYGHGLVEPALFIKEQCGIKKFATSMVQEAVLLREAGLDGFLMVLGGVPYGAVETVVQLDLVTPAYDPVFLKLLSQESQRQGKVSRVHIKIDTGLRRLGVRVGDQLAALLEALQQLPALEVEGILTHFSSPMDDDQTVTEGQLDEFDRAIRQVKEAGFTLQYIHAANSDAVTRNRRSHYNLVRPAALWLGYDPTGTYDVRPAITWKTFVSNVLVAEAGESISYFGSCIMKKRTKVAVLGFGAGDGYVRHLITGDPSKNGVVLIRGRRARLLSMNMDQAYADVTEIDGVEINDEVCLLGKMGDQEITMDELGRIAGTSTGHIQCSITSRPLRVYQR